MHNAINFLLSSNTLIKINILMRCILIAFKLATVPNRLYVLHCRHRRC